MGKTQETPEIEIIDDDDPVIQEPYRVILYNDDWHTFDEVIFQIIKATACSFEEARAMTFEVHVKGKCNVYSGSMPECLKVSAILEEIALHTQIVY